MANQDETLLSTGSDTYDPGWDWKNSYVSGLGANGEEFGKERFGLLSATPDSTAVLAGPPRFQGYNAHADLVPIGLIENLSFSQNGQLAQLYEIGSNRSFFTRGKTSCSLGIQQMLADVPSLMNVLTRISRRQMTEAGLNVYGADGNNDLTSAAAGGNGNVWLNLDSELTNVPFGMLLLFKTRGHGDADAANGRVLAAVYLENCMIGGLDMGFAATQPTMMQGLSAAFDRAVPVDIT